MKLLVVDSNSSDFIELSDLFLPLDHTLKLAISGSEALQFLQSFQPDIVFLDTTLSDMNGLDVLIQIRSSDEFKTLPVFIQTSDPSIDTKVRAFELGADDYIIRPFNKADLIDRTNNLLAMITANKSVDLESTIDPELAFNAEKIVFHSLRGGVGVSSLAVNTAVVLQQFWEKPTLVMDTAFFNGQVSMLLNINTNKHVGSLKNEYMNGQDAPHLLSIIEEHKSGVKVIAAPRYPIALDFLSEGFWASVATTLRTRFQYIVVDTPHDFSDPVICQLLDAAIIVLIVTPEMASLKVAVSALKTYKQLSINENRIRIVLNHIIPNTGIDRVQIEKALGVKIDLEIPYDPQEVLRAINIGTPYILQRNTSPIAIKTEELAFLLSTPESKKNAAEAPSKVLQAYLGRISSRNEAHTVAK